MSTVTRVYQYKKTDIYPRVNYFQRMLESLSIRFQRVIGGFDEAYLDKGRIEGIVEVVKILLRHPCIVIKSETSQFDVSRTAALKSAFSDLAYEEVERTAFGAEDLSMAAVVYYYKGTEEVLNREKFLDSLTKSKSELADIIDSTRGLPCVHKSAYVIRPETNVPSNLFIAVDVFDDNREDIGASRDRIERTLTALYGEDFVTERVLVKENVDIGCLISGYLENRVFIGFDNIDNYLRQFRKHDPSFYKVSNTLATDDRIKEFFRISLSNIDALILTMTDLCTIIGNGELSDEDVFFRTFVTYITSGLRGVVTQILFERFSLSQILIHQCLEKIDFSGRIQMSFNDDLALRSKVCDCLFGDVKPTETENKNITYLRKVKLKEHKLVKSLVDVLENVFQELEKEVKEVNSSVETVKKMSFEISGYYKRTKTRENRTSPKVTTSKELQTELFRLKDVIGCGFIYGIFEILVREDPVDKVIDDAIQAIMDHHKYIGQYTIKRATLNKSMLH